MRAIRCKTAEGTWPTEPNARYFTVSRTPFVDIASRRVVNKSTSDTYLCDSGCLQKKKIITLIMEQAHVVHIIYSFNRIHRKKVYRERSVRSVINTVAPRHISAPTTKLSCCVWWTCDTRLRLKHAYKKKAPPAFRVHTCKYCMLLGVSLYIRTRRAKTPFGAWCDSRTRGAAAADTPKSETIVNDTCFYIFIYYIDIAHIMCTEKTHVDSRVCVYLWCRDASIACAQQMNRVDIIIHMRVSSWSRRPRGYIDIYGRWTQSGSKPVACDPNRFTYVC